VNKRIRKKQIRRAAARQGGGEKGISRHLVSSSDYKCPLIERLAPNAESIPIPSVQQAIHRLHTITADRIVATNCKMVQIRNLRK